MFGETENSTGTFEGRTQMCRARGCGEACEAYLGVRSRGVTEDEKPRRVQEF